MKDEEMAEEWWNNWVVKDWNDLQEGKKLFIQAFLAGLKAGRPVWHDLRKNKNDLPKEDKQYLCLIKSWVGGEMVYACLIYNTQYHSWQESYGDVIAWCEIPTFDKE